VQWDQVRDLLALQERLDQMASGAPPGWSPPVDLYETADRYVITIEVPGLTREHVQIEAAEDRLSLSGSRPVPGGEAQRFHQVERGHGAFARTFVFAHPIDVDRVTAEAQCGVLTVTMLKKHRPSPRRIKVD
jgi:HSP20 family protein